MEYKSFTIKTKPSTGGGNSRTMYVWEYFDNEGLLVEESAEEFDSRTDAIEDCKQAIDESETYNEE